MPCFLICYSGFFILSSSFWFYSCEHEIRIDSQLCFKRISVSVLCVKGNLNLFHLSLSSNGSFDFFFCNWLFHPAFSIGSLAFNRLHWPHMRLHFNHILFPPIFYFEITTKKTKSHTVQISQMNWLTFHAIGSNFIIIILYKENVDDKQKSSYGRDSMAFEIDDQHHHLQHLCSFHSVIVFIVWGL